LKVVGVEESGG
jgi:hypothetical protein